ncbi:MAG: ABC transporter ATP-binding protein, partial [Pseudooceanicola sp.]|nr:ABC transporter ATP-binding protein [Pseudooceanicola sp.]
KPDLVIADEPTSALDVVVQRTVAQTLLAIKDGMGLSMLMIGHDLGLLAQVSDRVAVMYAGRLVEVAPVAELIARPRHPYTQALVASVPTLDRAAAETEAATGITHDPHDPPPGCIFHLRCPMAQGICRAEDPPWQGDRAAGVACHFADLATPVEEA